jgi:class 3 adenylate cyclase
VQRPSCVDPAFRRPVAYLAVAGVPDERPDHAEAGAEMALVIVEVLSARTWSNDDLVEVRIGVASGPAVADVIGRRKFTSTCHGETSRAGSNPTVSRG